VECLQDLYTCSVQMSQAFHKDEFPVVLKDIPLKVACAPVSEDRLSRSKG
jgi:hypothetical protein